jgi:hypothetical protein
MNVDERLQQLVNKLEDIIQQQNSQNNPAERKGMLYYDNYTVNIAHYIKI